MVNSQAPFLRQFFNLSVAEGVAAVPTHTTDDDCRQKVTPLEQTRLGHVGGVLQTQASYPTMNSVFATKPTIDWQFTTEDARIKLKRLYPSVLS